jgi:hypothetical protein
MISGICLCAILNTSLLFIDAHRTNKDINSTGSVLTTLHCFKGAEKVDKTFILNKTLTFQLLVGYTMNIHIPVDDCNECKNTTKAFLKVDDQLVIEIHEPNWISITQLNDSMSQCNYCTKNCLDSIWEQSLQQLTNQKWNLQQEVKNELHRPGLWIFIGVLLGAKIW